MLITIITKENFWKQYSIRQKVNAICQWRRSCVFIFNFEHISCIFLLFQYWLWTSKYRLCSTNVKIIFQRHDKETIAISVDVVLVSFFLTLNMYLFSKLFLLVTVTYFYSWRVIRNFCGKYHGTQARITDKCKCSSSKRGRGMMKEISPSFLWSSFVPGFFMKNIL